MITCHKIGRFKAVRGVEPILQLRQLNYSTGRIALEADDLKRLGITKGIALREEWSSKYAKTKQQRDQFEMMPLLRREPK